MAASAQFRDSLMFARENMKRLRLCLLAALLLVGSQVGCSRAFTRSPDVSDSIRKTFDKSSLELGERHEEIGPETKGKPSACIQWSKGSGRARRTLRKTVKTVATPKAVPEDREKKLQAENENHSQ